MYRRVSVCLCMYVYPSVCLSVCVCPGVAVPLRPLQADEASGSQKQVAVDESRRSSTLNRKLKRTHTPETAQSTTSAANHVTSVGARGAVSLIVVTTLALLFFLVVEYRATFREIASSTILL